MIAKPVPIFISYAHRDEDLVAQLVEHLWPLENSGLLEPWRDRRISAGSEWEREIDQSLERANVVLLMVSSSFMASHSCRKELDRATERHRRGECQIIPIILRPVYGWQDQSAFGKFQALPQDGKPITLWANVDDAFVSVCQGLARKIKVMIGEGPPAAPVVRPPRAHTSASGPPPEPQITRDTDRPLSSLTVNVFDGRRRLIPAGRKILYRVFDGNQQQVVAVERAIPTVEFRVPFYDNFGDSYRVIAFSDGYHQAGFTPVPLSPKAPTTLDLMLIPKEAGLNFAQADWGTIKTKLPFLASDVDDATGKDRYNTAMENKTKSLASLLNITTSMAQVPFSDGTTPLDYLKVMKWDDSLREDRFFAYCDRKLIGQVRAATTATGGFAPELNPSAFHPGATLSWKQLLSDEANLQLTFHEDDTKTIKGVDCVLVEPDIDYYRDLPAHILLETIPNFFAGGLTNPEVVYVLRWIVGRRAGVDFNPPYTIVG